MKFQHLPVGARFEYEGRPYVKTGPLTAAGEQGGQRMIPRWAVLKPADGAAPEPAARVPRQLDETTVLVAFQAYHAECTRLLAETGDGEAVQERLAAARRSFLEALAAM